jgi:hypothetical protein
MNKTEAYNALVQNRKDCHACNDLTNPAEYGRKH